MIGYLEYLNVPAQIGLAIVGIILVLQVIGELLEFKGKIVPEFMKVRKYFARKKRERETFEKVEKTLAEVNAHYNSDNIKMRDEWMKGVNTNLQKNDKWIQELDKKIDKINQDTLSLLIESKRTTIINFASYVIEEKSPVTREQFNRIFKLYEDYENIIEANNLTNGEVDIAIRIIREAYETHMRDHTFVEDIRGYGN